MKIRMAGFCLATFTVGALGQITGSGTTNQVAKFTSTTAVGNSAMTEANGNVGIGTTNPGTPLNVVANPSATIPQVRISPVGMTGSSTSLPSYLDFYSTFDAYPSDQGPRRTATIKALYSGGVWGNEALAFEVGTGGVNDAANELTERMRIAGNGNVGIGTANPGSQLEVHGTLTVSGSGAEIAFPDGTKQSTAWNGVLCGGDYAESVGISGSPALYEPGDVIVMDIARSERFLKSSNPYSKTVAGIFSTKPGLIGKRSFAAADIPNQEIPMAMIGIVPTKVSTENGAVEIGDLLVTSSTAGYAMKGTDASRMLGAVVGKAMQSLASGKGLIDVLVTLQ